MKTFEQYLKETLDKYYAQVNEAEFSQGMQDFMKQNRLKRSEEPATDPQPRRDAWKANFDKKFRAKMDTFKRPEEDIFAGSRYDMGNGKTIEPENMRSNNPIKPPNPASERLLRKDYRSPPAGYPDNVKDKLAAATARDNEPPMPGSGPYARRQSNPLVSSPPVPKAAVPVTSNTPTPPKPKLRPTAAQAPVQKKQSFGSAFADAKKRGDKVFKWNNKSYTTRTE